MELVEENPMTVDAGHLTHSQGVRQPAFLQIAWSRHCTSVAGSSLLLRPKLVPMPAASVHSRPCTLYLPLSVYHLIHAQYMHQQLPD